MGKQNVGPVQIAIAAVVALLVIGGLWYVFLGRGNSGPNVMQKMGPGYKGPGTYGVPQNTAGGVSTPPPGPPSAPPK
jgi:hypothetical protein